MLINVVACFISDNLAFGKQTNQSGVNFDGVSSRAVDGINNTDYYANSCTHTDRELNPWWRVDLGKIEPVSEIYLVNQENQWSYRQNNFEIRVGTVSNNGGITNPRCGNKSYSLPRGKGVSFFCRPVLLGRYVTIRSLRIDLENFTLCEVEVYSERRACQMQAIGVASTDTLPNASFSTSNESSRCEAFRGRLNAYGGWSPSRNDRPDDYLQIDLQYEFLICAVATQGRSTSDDWTTEYKLQLSFDGSTFVTYKENNVNKIFSGNSGRHDIVKHSLRNVRARFIRFQPVKFVGNKALRVEVYGVLISRVPSQPPSGLTVAASSFTSVLAFWRLPPEDSRNGIITGYKLFYRETGGDRSPTVQILIQNAAIRSRYITGLQADTEYDFQVLAFTSVGDGPKSSVKVVRTAVDAVEVGKREGSKSVSIVQIAVPVVLVIVLVPLLLVAILLYRRRRRAEKSGQEIDSNEVHVPLDEFRMDSVESGGITTDLVYQNVSEIPSDGNEFGKTSLPEAKESVYSEADDGKPKPIPVAEFAEYFKNKSANGSVVLEDEFEKLPSIFPFSWDVGKNNKVKNRFGNITTYDHSRVVLEKIEGDLNSDYINASYIPTVDEESMNYIATQGPTSTTISDFWRMIWQKNCSVIVMLTNLVELGKNKCDQYWPDNTTTFGSITVTLLRTQSFADYCIRTLKLVKGKKTREIHQYHFTSWPDRGVPHHSTALLAFRWKVHVQNQATGGPLVVHCSAGVGRTGTYIAIDAMLEGAKKKNTVFIQNYVQVMRKHRPYMVQNDTQYVFIHQAVMEALTCGTTEVTSQNLRIRMNKLARVMSDAKQTGYAEEFKDYSRRKAYILTQAPLNDTVKDFWRMISQYDIGTVVMLNSLKEEKEEALESCAGNSLPTIPQV
ncbi:hypothetical protein pdam_00021644 [Pocillopora damicornis]|uniref:Uncharacterized protein n=1 Tax=Pocillopora damicornis TaxID=46731 RepID=A0A3M6URM1_POCDA|nr:hypothetical protein pdam_00021644 [Pocillopora damicornis]